MITKNPAFVTWWENEDNHTSSEPEDVAWAAWQTAALWTALPRTGDPDFDAVLRECVAVLAIKGADYTIGSSDRLHNFNTVAEFVDLPRMKVWSTYFYKHVAAVFNFVKSNGHSESEPIEGRITDCINYLILFYKMVKEDRRNAEKP